MDDTASTSTHVVLGDVRRILDERRPAEETIRAIRRALEPPVEQQPVERTDRGWPVLKSAWERHDDPEIPWTIAES